MEFVEFTPLERINAFLSRSNLGERTIKGCLKAYSCKHTGTDKKLPLSLENEILDYLGKSSDTDSSSPAEVLLSRSSRKTLAYLVRTLCHMYSSELTWCGRSGPRLCFHVKLALLGTEEYLCFGHHETNEGGSLFETLYKALDEVVKLADCEIYCYSPDSDGDPFLERGAINMVADGFLMDDLRYEEDGDEIFDVMDIQG